MSSADSIIVFDGVCRLCNAALRFVDRRDVQRRFRYVPFQSDAGRLVCAAFALDLDTLDSFILFDNGHAYVKARAWARTLRCLPFPWSWVGWVLGVFPRRFSDFIYDLVGRNRYKWFGRLDACAWPREDDQRIASREAVESALGMLQHGPDK